MRERQRKPTHEELLTLHRYFVWAGQMQNQLLKLFRRRKDQRTVPELTKAMRMLASGRWRVSGLTQIRTFLYLSYWYGALHVVIDGWNQLHLSDPAVDQLLQSRNVKLLREYRNAVFHYQRRYYADKFTDLGRKGERVAEWVNELHVAIGDAILDRVKATPP